MRVKIITCIYSDLSSLNMGGRSHRKDHYRFSLLSLMKMSNADFLCYTSEREIEDLKNFFYILHNVSEEKLKFEVYDLTNSDYADVLNPMKEPSVSSVSDRSYEIQYSKFSWYNKEDKSYDYYFWFDAGSSNSSRASLLGQQSGTFDIAQVQLEEGSVATPFEHRPLGTELSLCQRYFISTRINSQNNGFLITGEATDTSSIVFGGIQFPVVMRAFPTTIVYSPSDATGRVAVWNDALTSIGSGFTIPNSHPQGIFTRANGSASLVVGGRYSFSYTADAEL